jgi:hypothetical protein
VPLFVALLLVVAAALGGVAWWLSRPLKKDRPVAAQADTQTIPPVAAPTAGEKEEEGLGPGFWLIGHAPGLAEIRWQIPPGRWRIGSLSDCLHQLPEEAGVAPHHLELHLSQGALVLTALGETLVNGQTIQEATLSDGDLVQLGRVQVIVRKA